ncbi:MAG: hypothetical protein JSR61_10175 [Proteobacteria bacterium]|nr:hypothetical protein [Pseudomonadota bacterium]
MASLSANENSALRRDASPDRVAEDDYRSFCEALGASARGRAFLEEYARRNRHADTEVVLEALNRLESTARSHKPAADADRIRQDLRALLDTLRTAKPQTENSPSAIKAATLSALIDFTQARLEALVAMPDDLRALEALAAVPAPEQPELPIPQPVAAAPAPSVVLTQPPLRVAETPIAEKIAKSAAPVAHIDADAIGIPKVEFDYEAQQAARPATKAGTTDATGAAWSELSPPPVAAPKVGRAPAADVAPQIESKIETTFESWPAVTAPEIVPPPAKAEAEPQAKIPLQSEAKPGSEAKPEAKLARAPQSKGESGRIAHAGEVETYELWLDDLSVETTVTAAIKAAAPAPAASIPTLPNPTLPNPTLPNPSSPQPAAPVVPPAALQAAIPAATGIAATAIEALVEQLQRPVPPGAAPATIGKIEPADPLAPILTLSDDERLALFT